MKARLQKMAANSADKSDSIQFRVEADEVEKHGKTILGMRRYDHVKVKCVAEQSAIGEDGNGGFPSLEFQSIATSLSMCVTEDGIIATITFSIDEPSLFQEVISRGLRNQIVEIAFKPGDNPYKK